MQILSKRTLREFWERIPRARGPLQAWYTLVEKGSWAGPAEVKATFGSTVDFVGDNRLIFDIGGNKYRLVVRIAYKHKRVMIKFIGTHSEYDQIDAESV